MLRFYLLVSLRTLRRYKSHSFINLFGLSIGVACCVLIYLYVDHELRHDAFHEKGDRIYKLLLEDRNERETGTLFPGTMTQAVTENAAGVRRVAAFIRSTARVRWKDSVLNEQIGLVSPEFLEVFTLPLLHGDPRTAVESRDAAARSSQVSTNGARLRVPCPGRAPDSPGHQFGMGARLAPPGRGCVRGSRCLSLAMRCAALGYGALVK